MKVTVSSGETELGSDDARLDGKFTPAVERAKASVGFELTEQTVITVSVSKESGADPVLSWIGIAQALPNTITTQEGITASVNEAYEGETVTLNGNFAKYSLFVKDENGTLSEVTYNDDGTASFTMPKKAVSITGLVNTDTTTYVVPDSIERVLADGSSDSRNFFIRYGLGLGMTFTIPEGTYTGAKLNFIRQNTAGGQLTNIYDQTEDGFSYVNGEGYIAQYGGGSQTELDLNTKPASGEYKLLFAYDTTDPV